MSPEAIARVTGTPVGSVKVFIKRHAIPVTKKLGVRRSMVDVPAYRAALRKLNYQREAALLDGYTTWHVDHVDGLGELLPDAGPDRPGVGTVPQPHPVLTGAV